MEVYKGKHIHCNAWYPYALIILLPLLAHSKLPDCALRFSMRSTTDIPVAANPHQVAHTAFVSRTADLSITIQAEEKSKKPVKYRAIQRSDGVVVEKPRYSPATSVSPRPKTTPVTSGAPATFPGVGRHDAIIKRLDMDLAAKRSSWEAMSSVCASARADDSGQPEYDRCLDSMRRRIEKVERYLTTDGPWSAYELSER
jgi:hypothetical protein